MAQDSTKVVPLRRAPVKKRGPIEQVLHDVTHGVPELVMLLKGAGEKVKGGFRKIKDFVK